MHLSTSLNKSITAGSLKSNSSAFLTSAGKTVATAGSDVSRESSEAVSPVEGGVVTDEDPDTGPSVIILSGFLQ